MVVLKTSAPTWAVLLSGRGGQDNLAATVDGIRRALDMHSRLRGGGAKGLGARDFAQAAAASLHSKDSMRVLSASLALLIVLEEAAASWPASDIVELGEDSLYSGLIGALSATSAPVSVAAAARALCALTATLAAVSTAKEDRQARPRRAVGQLRAALEAHPKTLLVQEAFTQGCCAILAGDGPGIGQQPSTLWTLLWPLAVHPRADVAAAAAASLCRLTRLARLAGSGGGDEDRQQQGQNVRGMHEAIFAACKEFEDFFRPMHSACKLAIKSSKAPPPASLNAVLQCTRLLELMKSLTLYGASAVRAAGRRDDPSGMSEKRAVNVADADDAMALILPLGGLLGTVDLVVTALLQDTSVLVGLLTEASITEASGILDILDRALELSVAAVGVAGSMLLTQTRRLRCWLELFVEAPLIVRQRFGRRIAGFVDAIADAAPAVLLKEALVQKLVGHTLTTMRRACGEQEEDDEGEDCVLGAAGIATTSTSHSSTAGAQQQRKRRYGEAFTPAAASGGARPRQRSDQLELFRSSCLMLSKLTGVAAPMLKTGQIATACEQIIRVMWLGLVAPAAGRGIPSNAAVGFTNKSAADVNAYRIICRDADAVLALLDVVEVFHRPQRAGVLPLAPRLIDAFAALLDAIVSVHRRSPCGPQHHVNATAVQWRALQVSDAVLAAAGRAAAPAGSAAPAAHFGSSAKTSAITIEWPAILVDPPPVPEVIVQAVPTSPPATVRSEPTPAEIKVLKSPARTPKTAPEAATTATPPTAVVQVQPPQHLSPARTVLAAPALEHQSPLFAATTASPAAKIVEAKDEPAVDVAMIDASTDHAPAEAAPVHQTTTTDVVVKAGTEVTENVEGTTVAGAAEAAAAVAAELAAEKRSRSKALAPLVINGTEMLCKEESIVFESPTSNDTIETLSAGSKVVAAGPPLEVDGFFMVPIRPRGALQLDFLEVVALAGAASQEAVSDIAVNSTAMAVDAAAAAQPLELFPGGDDSPVPELCMDSPSSDE